MKMKHLLLSGILAFSLTLSAQEVTSVIEKTDNIGTENGTVLSTKINRAIEKDIVKEWKSKMKGFDGEVKVKGATITATSVKIESIDSNPIEVIAKVINSTDQEFELVVMFIKNSVSISSESDLMGFTAGKNIVRNFANEMSKEATEGFQKIELKAFDKVEKELESAKKDKEKAEKDTERAKKAIEDAKNTIIEAEATIKEKTKFIADNKKTQAGLVIKLEEQKKRVKIANDEMDLFK